MLKTTNTLRRGGSAASVLAAVGLSTAGLFTSGHAAAQAAGTLLVRGGVTRIQPHVSSGDLSAPALTGSQVDIGASTRPSGGVTWMVTDAFSLDFPLALPFRHDIDGAGAIAGVGKVGDVKALPVTLLGQWRFLDPASRVRPYLGAGVTYAKFYGGHSTAALTALSGGTPASPTTLSVDSKFAATVEAGLTVAIDAHWFVDATVLHTFLKTRTTLSTGQSIETRLNPNTFQLGVGYAF